MKSPYIIMPSRLTAENGAKYHLSSKFLVRTEMACPECGGDGLGAPYLHAQGQSPCVPCNGTGYVDVSINIPWSTIKEIYASAVDLLGCPAPRLTRWQHLKAAILGDKK